MTADQPEVHGTRLTAQTSGDRSPAIGVNYGSVLAGDAVMPVTLPPVEEVIPRERIHNLPRPRLNTFVGRVAELEQLKSALCPEGRRVGDVVTQMVSGLGGIGKTALVLHCAHEAVARDAYPIVWWLNAETPEALTQSFTQLTLRLNPGLNIGHLPEEFSAEWALAWLQTQSSSLLIFDNASQPDVLAPYLARLDRSDCVITTRRTNGWNSLTCRNPIHLDVLDPPSSVALLRTLSQDDPDASRLAEELGHLPLALEHAGTYIRRLRWPHAKYLEHYRSYTNHFLESSGHGDPHGITIARTWRVTLDVLADRDPEVVQTLQVLAWFASEGVSRDLLALLTDPPFRADEQLALLADFSMVTTTADTVSVHRVVQALARTPSEHDPHRSVGAIHRALCIATDVLAAALPDRNPQTDVTTWEQWRKIVPHIESLVEHADPNDDTEITGLICFSASQFLKVEGQGNRALRLAQRATDALVRMHGEIAPVALTVRRNLAAVYREIGDAGRAVPMFKDLLSDTEQVHGSRHPNTLMAKSDLADAYELEGDFGQALTLFKSVLAEQEEVMGPRHPHTVATRSSLADACQIAGETAEALTLSESVLSDREELMGPRHPSTLDARHSLAYSHLDAGDAEQASTLLESVVADHEEVMGPRHPRTLNARHNLARAYQVSGQAEQALILLEATLADHEEVMGSRHPNTLNVRYTLASAYADADDVDSAITILDALVTDTERILGCHHHKTLTARYQLGSHYMLVGDMDRAISTFKVLSVHTEEAFGLHHPESCVVRQHLDCLREIAAGSD
ncbi:FxSxx-COOH system tetratricopeptide repeat protein [Streptomyces sp. NPDC052052]|uniref:FxSxx-COOH system tetratricopeptide repeat protein n=1 Tax=Streptomyces sp. NPDC052052 TaxID=3154756 RepID=UPI0034261247